jgi:hypothetical protein
MTTSSDPHSIRAFLMKDALAEEEKNWKRRAWSVLFLVMAGGYCFGFGILLMVFSKTVYPLPFIEANWFAEWVLPVPASILAAVGIMGRALSSKNTVMELCADERAQIDGSPDVWHNLPPFGRMLLAIFGSALALGIIAIVLRIIYKVVT